ncbi:hypothetical protein SVIOM342S_03550 [Streptomyces violaceorubidus]
MLADHRLGPGWCLPATGLGGRRAVPALRSAVEALPAAESLVARYHRGWCEADGAPRAATSGGGKTVRPALALLSAVAVGADPSQAVPGAVAVELVHDFTLLPTMVIEATRCAATGPPPGRCSGPPRPY